ncbi:hypothetical protein RA29_17890 [Tateyamaria sp. ANG-S1]|nr:hypothetical protein RA29_17890 [Tateyamaria sp. ANG-S1]
MSERAASWNRSDLEVQALQWGKGVSPDQILAEVDRRIDEGSLFVTDAHTITDKASVALESSILMTFHAAKETPALDLATEPDRTPEALLARRLAVSRTLTEGQKEAITTSLTGAGRYVGVQGFAGTGKTFMLERVNAYAKESDYEVAGYAPSHQAVSEFKSVLGDAATLASLIAAERHSPECSCGMHIYRRCACRSRTGSDCRIARLSVYWLRRFLELPQRARASLTAA